MNTRMIHLALIATFAFPAHAALNKCVQPDGGVAYQQTQCPETAEESTVRVYNPSSTTDVPTDDGLIQACFQANRTLLKDPESARFEGGYTEYVALRDVGAGKRVHVWINGINSYGAYAGKKRYSCIFGVHGGAFSEEDVIE